MRIALTRGCDIVHIHHLSRAAVVAALSPLARPLIYTQHTTGLRSSMTHRLAERFVTSRAATVVCCSQAEAAAKRATFRLPGDRTVIIPNGVTLDAPPATPRRLSTSGPVRLLFVGQLRPVKQVHRAIEALAQLPSHFVLRLVFHVDELANELAALAARLGVADRVTFVGQRWGAELLAEYQRAHVLVLPSASEALPSVVTEALLTGLPVLASAVGGVPTQVGRAGVLVGSAAAEPLAPSIQRLVGDYCDLADQAVARSTAIRAEYSVQEMIARHIELYERLAG